MLILDILFQPRKLKLTETQALYVESLFMGGSGPEEIARGMGAMFGRERFPYFKIKSEDGKRLEFGPAALDIEGLEYLRAAMIRLGAIKVKGKYDYYQTDHRMTRKISSVAATAPLPSNPKETAHG